MGMPDSRANRFAALHTSKSLRKQERLELENLKLSRGEHPVSYLCETTSVNRSKYSKWLKREIKQYERSRRNLAKLIKRIYSLLKQ